MAYNIRLLTVAAVGAASIFGIGCGRAAEKISESASERAIEAAGGGDVELDIDQDTGEFRMETEDGTIRSGSGEIPDAWPEDISLPSLTDVTSSQITDTGSGELVTVVGTTSLSAEDAEEHFADALGGWTQASRTSFGGDGGQTVQVGYELGDRTLLVGIVDDGSSVILSLSHTVAP